ncbi:MAG: hypothetical protein OXE83_14870 [Gammaproteobacteria bacterium]|nr:hypothetical protein [Gammaproteobacteria bacterium]
MKQSALLEVICDFALAKSQLLQSLGVLLELLRRSQGIASVVVMPRRANTVSASRFGDVDGNGRMDRTCGCASMIPGCHNRFPGVAHAEGGLRRTRDSADAAFEALGASEQARAAAA